MPLRPCFRWREPDAGAAVALLPAGDCPAGDLTCKQVCVLFRDDAGNVDTAGAGPGGSTCDTIALDTVKKI